MRDGGAVIAIDHKRWRHDFWRRRVENQQKQQGMGCQGDERCPSRFSSTGLDGGKHCLHRTTEERRPRLRASIIRRGRAWQVNIILPGASSVTLELAAGRKR